MYDTLILTVISNKELLAKWENHMATVTGNRDMHPFYGAPTVIPVSSVVTPPGNINYSNAAIVIHNMAIALGHTSKTYEISENRIKPEYLK